MSTPDREAERRADIAERLRQAPKLTEKQRDTLAGLLRPVLRQRRGRAA